MSQKPARMHSAKNAAQKGQTTSGRLSPRVAAMAGTSFPKVLYSTATANRPSSTPGSAAE